MFIRIITLIGLMLTSFSSSAVWLDTTGKISSVVTYSGRDTVLVNLDVQGAAVETCSNRVTFAVSAANSPEQRARMFSMLLAAQAADRRVTVSYNDVGGCEAWGATQNVFRRITRLSFIN